MDDPVSKYVPEFANPIVLDDVTKANPSYTPAKEVVTIKHLLNFTCGLFYPWGGMALGKMIVQYSSPQNKEDPIGEFFRLVKVGICLFPFIFPVRKLHRGIYLAFHSNSNLGQIVSNFILQNGAPGKLIRTFLSSLLWVRLGRTWFRGREGVEINTGRVLVCSDWLNCVLRVGTNRLGIYFSKENIFKPLGIKLSFHSTPDLLERLVALTIRREGKLELYDPNIRVAERDPEKGTSGLLPNHTTSLTWISISPTGRCRSIFLGS